MADDNYSLKDILWEYSDFTPPGKGPAPLAPQAPELSVAKHPAEKSPTAPPPPGEAPQGEGQAMEATRRFVPGGPTRPPAGSPPAQPPSPAPPQAGAASQAGAAPRTGAVSRTEPVPQPQEVTAPAQGGPLVEGIAKTVQAVQQAQSAPTPPASPPETPPAEGTEEPQGEAPAAPEPEAPAGASPAPAEGEGDTTETTEKESDTGRAGETAPAPAPPEGEASASEGEDNDQEEEEEEGEPQEVPTADDGPDLLVFGEGTQKAQEGQGPREAAPPPPEDPAAGTAPPDAEAEAAPKFHFPWERQARTPLEPPPDAPPGQLAKEYEELLGSLRPRSILSMVVAVLLLAITYTKVNSFFPMLNGLIPDKLILPVGLVLLGICAVLALEVLEEGALHLIHLRPNEDTLALLATLFTVVDTATMMTLEFRPFTVPFLAPCALVLAFHLLGHYCTISTRLEACKTAATVAQPYRITKDPEIYGSQSAFRKWIGTPAGFGSQIRSTSQGALRFQRLTIVLLAACLGLGLLTTVAHHQPKMVFWSLSALFIAASTLGAPMMLSLPVKLLSKKLSRLGVALAGWPGIDNSRGCRTAALGDYDLYPPGSVVITKATPLGAFSADRVVSLAASVVRVSASGLAYPFDRLLQEYHGNYSPVERLLMQPGGLAGQIGGMQVYVGNSSFMSRLGHTIPPEIKAKDAIFCAVDGDLAGAFLLRYTLHPTILPALRAMFAHRLSPLLVTRDFNLSPHRLRLSGQLPANKINFPDLQKRFLLSGPKQRHDDTLVAVLCREGLPPFSDALISARRIRRAHGLNTILVCVSACVGVFLTATLSSGAATAALTAWTLSMYLLLWFVPVLMLSLWVKQY